jgi:hypothetical protein
MSTPESRPIGVVLLSSFIGLFGAGSVLSSVIAIALDLGRLPRWGELLILTYGAVGTLTGVLLFRMSPCAHAAFVCWSLFVLVLYGLLILAFEDPLLMVPSALFMLVLLFLGQRYIHRTTIELSE